MGKRVHGTMYFYGFNSDGIHIGYYYRQIILIATYQTVLAGNKFTF